ncbi:hypothetical protein E1293_23370 [Actinomadura darangshiensis]|uniref:Uncharacterized protein n=1 Tax=Actinomadura darangshiensis TaxID=705336 RepID=A0A4R5B846_9ACTN|nr:hypothetical protein [Actinomadura darangshiensis]TDD79462.1 hypothetical protein E1293_23370 [Actinomadura darangshiensis]
MSTTQLIASAVATAVAAFGASYLGVYGTIIGAALMSVISTAGSAVGKHYLDQGRDQIRERTQLQSAVRRRDAAGAAAAEATSADPTRTAVWSGDPNATRFDPPSGGDPNATRLDPGGDPNATRLDPAETVAAGFAQEAGADAVREAVRRSAWQSTVAWAKAHWVKLVVSSAAVFAVVIGGITIVEATTGQPIGSGGDKGLTVTKVLGGNGGGQPDGTPSQNPSQTPTEPGATPSDPPTGDTPSTGTSTPPPEPTTEPTEQPTREPTAPPTTEEPPSPDTPAPTGGPQEGGEGATGQQDGGNTPAD